MIDLTLDYALYNFCNFCNFFQNSFLGSHLSLPRDFLGPPKDFLGPPKDFLGPPGTS